MGPEDKRDMWEEELRNREAQPIRGVERGDERPICLPVMDTEIAEFCWIGEVE